MSFLITQEELAKPNNIYQNNQGVGRGLDCYDQIPINTLVFNKIHRHIL